MTTIICSTLHNYDNFENNSVICLQGDLTFERVGASWDCSGKIPKLRLMANKKKIDDE